MADRPRTPSVREDDRFPNDRSLCVSCGYPLRGLAARAPSAAEVGAVHGGGGCGGRGCPECGKPIAESDPRRRPGLPFQRRPGVGSLAATAAAVVVGPSRSFARMSVLGSNGPGRLYLLAFVLLGGLVWWLIWRLLGVRGGLLGGAVFGAAMTVMTYIEAAGVTWFGRRRGWPVRFATAERVACYASVGWLPSAAVLSLAQGLAERGLAANYWPSGWGPYPVGFDLAISAGLVAVSVVWFEALVWLGVRQVRYALPS